MKRLLFETMGPQTEERPATKFEYPSMDDIQDHATQLKYNPVKNLHF
jgi:hypothetical protein